MFKCLHLNITRPHNLTSNIFILFGCPGVNNHHARVVGGGGGQGQGQGAPGGGVGKFLTPLIRAFNHGHGAVRPVKTQFARSIPLFLDIIG